MGKEWYWSRSISREEKGGHGCMSGMLHFLDFHQLLFTSTATAAVATPATKYGAKKVPQSSPLHPCSPTDPKGFEAPRNSLELNETIPVVKGEYFDVPINPTAASSSDKKIEKMTHFLEEERRSSQAGTPRTPGLVARLMGLDVLPEQASTPVFYSLRSTPTCRSPPTLALGDNKDSQRKKKKNNKKDSSNDDEKEMHYPRRPLKSSNCNTMGSHSLPDTPRASSARRSWDVDPRLSLQLNKENRSPDFGYLSKVSEDCPLPSSPVALKAKLPSKASSRHPDENKSPRMHNHYAREIVKQVKESISKRRSSAASAANDNFTATKLKGSKPSQRKAAHENAGSPRLSKASTPSCSPPRHSFSDSPVASNSSAKFRPRLKPTRPPPPPPPLPPERIRTETKASIEAGMCKKVGYERFTKSIKKNISQPASRLEAQVTAPSQRKKYSSIHSLSSTNSNARLPAAKLRRDEDVLWPSSIQCSRTEPQDLELEYVISVLEHANLLTAPPPSFRWHSPSHPIDPVIFHRLELRHHPGKDRLPYRSNRKLLFHLVDEIIGDISQCSRLAATNSDGEAFLQRVWKQIQSYPSADCKVMDDIDALVEGDLPARNVRWLLQHPGVGEEAAEVAAEIERDILDSLLGELR